MRLMVPLPLIKKYEEGFFVNLRLGWWYLAGSEIYCEIIYLNGMRDWNFFFTSFFGKNFYVCVCNRR